MTGQRANREQVRQVRRKLVASQRARFKSKPPRRAKPKRRR